MDINQVRKWFLAIGEWLDAWRIIPRTIVTGYAYLIYIVVRWYMDLQPFILQNCNTTPITDCIIQAPTTQHAALVTAVISIAAAIFGLYANSGRKWDTEFKKWSSENEEKEDAESNDSASK